MDDQDWINLQKLIGRPPQPAPADDETPFHLQYAEAPAALGGAAPPLDPEELANRRLWADAVANFDKPQPPDPYADERRQLLAHALRAYGGPGAAWAPAETSDAGPAPAPQQRLLSAAYSGGSPAPAGPSFADASPADPSAIPLSSQAVRTSAGNPAPATQYAMGSPAGVDPPWQTMADQYTPPPARPAPPTPRPTAPPSAVQTTIDPIPGYDETGDNAWRAANDKIFLDAVNRYNAANGYRPGDPGYWTADMLKAQAMVETGGNKKAFLTDPLQVNTPGNWDPVYKPKVTGLTSPKQAMTPQISADAALKWLQYKGWMTDKTGQRGYIGDEGALWRYNGDTTPRSHYTGNSWDAGLNQQDWYADTIPRLAREAAAARTGRRADDDFGLAP